MWESGNVGEEIVCAWRRLWKQLFVFCLVFVSEDWLKL